MKKFIIISVVFFSLPLWDGWGGAFAQEVTKDSVVQSASKYIDSLAGKKITDNIIARSTTIQQLYKKIAEDSIAQSNAIQQLYNKITENSITQSNAIQQLYNKITEDSIAGLPHPLPPLQLERGLRGEVQPALTIDVGQVFSTFKFVDSQGNKLKELTTNSTTGFSLGYHYPLQNGLFIRANAGFRKGGASMIYEGLNVNWSIQYADANIGLGYMYHKWRLKPYFSTSPYFGYMLKANQIIGADSYDIKEIKSMKTTDFGLFFSPGLKVVLSKSIAFYAEYKYILGLKNLETSTDKKSYNRGFSINLGVAVTVESLKVIKFVK